MAQGQRPDRGIAQNRWSKRKSNDEQIGDREHDAPKRTASTLVCAANRHLTQVKWPGVLRSSKRSNDGRVRIKRAGEVPVDNTRVS